MVVVQVMQLIKGRHLLSADGSVPLLREVVHPEMTGIRAVF